jgi:hypothetical protein
MSNWLNDTATYRRVRGEHGFSEIDVWNADTYLAGLIGTMALWHRDHGSTYPDGMTVGEWHAILTKIGEPLVAYANGKFTEKAAPLVTDAREALILFAQNFENLWD